jgi:hypothetical protein
MLVYSFLDVGRLTDPDCPVILTVSRIDPLVAVGVYRVVVATEENPLTLGYGKHRTI